jgi:hypothetical protein
MGTFNFWQKWLLCVAVYLVFFGLVLCFFSHAGLLDFFFNQNIDPYFWPAGSPPVEAYKFQGWIYGVLGAVMSGWGILVAFWAHYPFKAREPWAWTGLALGVGVWFVADTSISAVYGVFFNVAFNTVFLVFLAAPLVFTRKYFAGSK